MSLKDALTSFRNQIKVAYCELEDLEAPDEYLAKVLELYNATRGELKVLNDREDNKRRQKESQEEKEKNSSPVQRVDEPSKQKAPTQAKHRDPQEATKKEKAPEEKKPNIKPQTPRQNNERNMPKTQYPDSKNKPRNISNGGRGDKKYRFDENRPENQAEDNKPIQATLITTNPYKLLGVTSNASKSEVDKAFRKMALIHHPDKNPDNAESVEMFQKIQNAKDQIERETERDSRKYVIKWGSRFPRNLHNDTHYRNDKHQRRQKRAARWDHAENVFTKSRK